MKAKEFITEQSTLAQAAAANRASFKRQFLKRNPEVANTIDAVKGTAQAIKGAWSNLKNRATDKAIINRYAEQFADTWEQKAQELGADVDLNTYKKELANWIQSTLGFRADPAALDRYVTSTDITQIENYFRQYFVPKYLEYKQQQKQQQQPQTQTQQQGVQVPRGQRIVVVHPVNRGKYYKTAQGWTNEAGQPITKQSSIDYLEDLVDNDPVKYEPV